MQLLDFSQALNGFSNHKLYLTAYKFVLSRLLGCSLYSTRFETLVEECYRRNPNIYKDAFTDALFEFNSIIECTNITKFTNTTCRKEKMKVVSIKRLDYMDEADLTEMLQTIGAARRHTIVADDTRKVSIYEAWGMKKENVFLCKVSGTSMKNVNIQDGSTLVVDTSVEAKDGDIIVAELDGEAFVKRYKVKDGVTWLISENDVYQPVMVNKNMSFRIFGVVRHVYFSFF